MKKVRDTEKIEKTILWISFGAGTLFAVLEFLFAIFTQSQSVLMDAVYDASELIIIVFTLFLTPLFYKPISEKHPYGFSQVESIFIIIKGFMMLSVTLGLSANNINIVLSGGHYVDGGAISVFQLGLGILSLLIFFLMCYLNKKGSSPTVKMELLGWRLDIMYSLGMSIAFFASTFLNKTPLAFLAPYFDQIVAILIVVFALPQSLKMLWRAIQDIFLFSPEQDTVDEIKAICGDIMSSYDFNPVFYDITRTGRYLWVSIYFNVSEDTLNIAKFNKASSEISQKLKDSFEFCSGELILLAEKSQEKLSHSN